MLQSYGLRPQVSYESSEEANSSDLDEASYEEAVNVSIREAFGDEEVDVDSIRADLARMPPMWQAAISDSLRASQALSESPEFVHAVRAAEAADNAGIIGAALSEHLYTDSDSDSEDDDGVFPWSTSVTGSALDDAMTESTRAAADEMLRAADVSHEVASLFASRAPRGVASWEDARRGLDLDAVAATRFGNGDVSKPAPSARGFEPPCDRSFGFFRRGHRADVGRVVVGGGRRRDGGGDVDSVLQAHAARPRRSHARGRIVRRGFTRRAARGGPDGCEDRVCPRGGDG